MAFTLKLSNDYVTVDLMNATDYKVYDGGFNIGLPEVERELGVIRPGFFRPVSEIFSYREATIKLDIMGTTRSDVLTNLRQLQRMFRRTNSRDRLSVGRRMELQYQWDGASQITYFEVYSGDVNVPDDVLQLEKMFYMRGTKYAIEASITMTVSADGYGISVLSSTLTEVALSNGGSYVTGGVTVANGAYAEVASTSLTGASPLITKIVVAPSTGYTAWNTMFIGHELGPYSTKLKYDIGDSGDLVYDTPPGTLGVSGGYGGTHEEWLYGTGTSTPGTWANLAWAYDNGTIGMFYAFLHGYTKTAENFKFAIGIDDYTRFGIRNVKDFVRPSGYCNTIPLGALQLPSVPLELTALGNIHEDLWIGLWVAKDYTLADKTLSLDFLSFLPINGGLRIWQARTTAVTSCTMIDDGWAGIEYVKDSTPKYWTPFYGLIEPIKLEPGLNQRLRFQSIGTQDNATEQARELVVQLYVVPTWPTLAL